MIDFNKFVAPNINHFLSCFDRSFRNPSKPDKALSKAIDSLFNLVKDVKPMIENNEVKLIWIRVPRGDISDFGDYKEMLENEEVTNYDEYVDLWKYEYPSEYEWYELILSEGKDFKGVFVNEYLIVNANHNAELKQDCYDDEITIGLLKLLMKGISDSISLMKNGNYFEVVNFGVPYKYRKGLIKRKDIWAIDKKEKEATFEGLSDDAYNKFCSYIESGENEIEKIGRIKNFTAYDFFNACAIGYKACGYEGTDLPIVDQYLKHADGRDEGLTGRGYGLDKGKGIDLNDSSAWDEWYNDKSRFGGHPWEVCRGGNSTHVSLCVTNYDKSEREGYYFVVAGKSFGRSVETVNFYVSIKEAGYPIVIDEGEAILARFKATDYIGIVPHNVITRYCESMFDKKYGIILDFMHVYNEELEKFGDKIEWLPLELE